MSLIKKFDALMSHLNAGGDILATEFNIQLRLHILNAEDNAKWRECLEAGGVDNWSWYGESLSDGGYHSDEEDEDDE